MSFEGGPLSLLGVKPEGLINIGSSIASSTVSQAVGQVWQGSGQSFIGRAGQAVAGNLAGAAVNVALNSAFGTSVAGSQGLPLDSGANLLATVVTPQVTGAIAAGINQQLQQTLQDAGPFGPLLSDIGGGLVNQALNGITNSITGGAIAGGGPTATGENYKMFPGGGGEGEAPADYGGSSYTLEDIVFSLRRAYGGAQSDGDAQAINAPPTATTVAANQVAGAGNMPSGSGSPATEPSAPVTNKIKAEAMGGSQAPLRDQPLWGDSQVPQAPLRDQPLWGERDASSIPTNPYNNTGEWLQDPNNVYAQYTLRRWEAAGVPRSDVKSIIRKSNWPYDTTPPALGYIDKYGNRQPLPVSGAQTSVPGRVEPLW